MGRSEEQTPKTERKEEGKREQAVRGQEPEITKRQAPASGGKTLSFTIKTT
jgi:hypothetical protein